MNHHPSEQDLLGLFFKLCSDPAARTIERHLKDCPDCQARANRLRATIGLLDTLKTPVEIPEKLVADTLRSVRQTPSKSRLLRFPSWSWVGGAAAAAALLLLIARPWQASTSSRPAMNMAMNAESPAPSPTPPLPTTDVEPDVVSMEFPNSEIAFVTPAQPAKAAPPPEPKPELVAVAGYVADQASWPEAELADRIALTVADSPTPSVEVKPDEVNVMVLAMAQPASDDYSGIAHFKESKVRAVNRSMAMYDAAPAAEAPIRSRLGGAAEMRTPQEAESAPVFTPLPSGTDWRGGPDRCVSVMRTPATTDSSIAWQWEIVASNTGSIAALVRLQITPSPSPWHGVADGALLTTNPSAQALLEILVPPQSTRRARYAIIDARSDGNR